MHDEGLSTILVLCIDTYLYSISINFFCAYITCSKQTSKHTLKNKKKHTLKHILKHTLKHTLNHTLKHIFNQTLQPWKHEPVSCVPNVFASDT